MIQQRFVDTMVGKIAVYESGEGQPLVLLHANAHDHSDFDLIQPALAEKYRVIAVDWPGHGASGFAHDPRSATVVQLADTLPEIVTALGLKKPFFVGNSIGGYAALRYALRFPENTRGLVLINSGGFNSGDLKAKIFCNIMGVEWIAGAMWNLFPQMYLRIKTPHVLRILKKIQSRKNPASVQMFAALWKSFLLPAHDLREAARHLKVPALLIWGKRDPVIPVGIGRFAAGVIPGAQLKMIDSGHEPYAEAPEAFLAAAMPFLENLP